MPVPQTTKWVAAGSLALLVASSATAAATAAVPAPRTTPAPVAAPITPGSPQETLAAVRAAFDGARPAKNPGVARSTNPEVSHAGRDLTLMLLDLHRVRALLKGEDRRAADAFLARPTDGPVDVNSPTGAGYQLDADVIDAADDPANCGPHVCITRDNNFSNPDYATPEQAQLTLAVMESVWSRIVTQGGYRAPLADQGTTVIPKEGVNSKLDVYLADLGGDGYYGYCNIDGISGTSFAAPGYCVLDNDYSASQFGNANTPTENLQVTAAHEFFHAVQFAYDFAEDRWLMEGTAAWIEDELYDAVNDNIGYLAKSQLTDPAKPLDYYGGSWHPYGSWVWWRFLSERFPATQGTGLPLIIRDIWRRADDANPARPGTYSLDATVKALAARNQNFAGTYGRFGVANRQPKRAYAEGAAYPTAPLLKSYRLSKSKRTFPLQMATMPHLTNFTVAIKPGTGLRSAKWKLRLNVDAPDKKRGPFALVTVVSKSGARSTKVITLNKRGVGSRTVAFSNRTVARVELTMTNAGRRYDCYSGTTLSCQGRSLDNGLKTYFKATAVR